MRFHLWLLSAFAVLAWSASPADAQPRTRDHRTKTFDAGAADSRPSQSTRARRGKSASDDDDDRGARTRDHRRPGTRDADHSRDRTRARADRGKTAERERRARERWREQRKSLPKAGKDRRRWLEEEEDKLRRTREERRRARAARVRAQWERQFLAHPQVRHELELHSKRSANLARMRRLAVADDHDRLVVRIDILIERENTRHERRMATLREQLR